MDIMQASDTEPVTTGDNPEMYTVTVSLSNYAAQRSFYDWLASGAATEAFWRWCSVNGRLIR